MPPMKFKCLWYELSSWVHVVIRRVCYAVDVALIAAGLAVVAFVDRSLAEPETPKLLAVQRLLAGLLARL